MKATRKGSPGRCHTGHGLDGLEICRRTRDLLSAQSVRDIDTVYTAVFYQDRPINEVGIYAYRFVQPMRSDDFKAKPEFNGRLFVIKNELLVLLWHEDLTGPQDVFQPSKTPWRLIRKSEIKGIVSYSKGRLNSLPLLCCMTLRIRLNIVIEEELIRMGSQPQGIDLIFPLVSDPCLITSSVKTLPLSRNSVVCLQRIERSSRLPGMVGTDASSSGPRS